MTCDYNEEKLTCIKCGSVVEHVGSKYDFDSEIMYYECPECGHKFTKIKLGTDEENE